MIRAPVGRFDEFSRSDAVRYAARALGRLAGREAVADLEFVLAIPDVGDSARDEAAEALLAMEGLPGVYEIADAGREGAPRAVGVIELAATLKTQVDNGGISQFFFNRGSVWRECVKALYELGCPVTAKSVARSASTLGLDEGGNPQAKYAELSDEDEKRMGRDARIFEGEEDIVRVTTKYALAHAAEIRGWLQRQAAPAAGGTIPLA